LVMSRSSCPGMLIPCPPQAVHALHTGPPAGPPTASSWCGDTCDVSLTVCGGHAADVCRRERLIPLRLNIYANTDMIDVKKPCISHYRPLQKTLRLSKTACSTNAI